MIITLAGIMGVGKSSIGKELSEEIGFRFIDLDDFISDIYGKDIRELFAEHGEKGFREIEHSALKTILDSADGNDIILSLGGGTPTVDRNRKLLKERCLNIYLKADIEKIVHNLTAYGENRRPLLNGLSTDGIRDRITELMVSREPYYMEIADITADVSGYIYGNNR